MCLQFAHLICDVIHTDPRELSKGVARIVSSRLAQDVLYELLYPHSLTTTPWPEYHITLL